MTPLASYLRASSTTQAAFAEALSVTQPTVNRWVKGLARPNWAKAAEIERLTGGQVPVSAWADDPATAAE